MKRLSSVAFLLLAVLLAQPGAARPNILLIVSEDNGPELGCYGDPYVRTPVLDRLAARGTRFANAFPPYSVCSPSRACFLTGLDPALNRGRIAVRGPTRTSTMRTSLPGAAAEPVASGAS